MDSPLGHFLTAEWRNLAVLNFAIEADRLLPFVPQGTELDLWHGTALVSLVGFEFRDTRVWGCPIPYHRNFEEVNLRFYVRRKTPEGWRRGVSFLRELVPRRAVSWVARLLYGENYATARMGHRVDPPTPASGSSFETRYWWYWDTHECRLELRSEGFGSVAQPGTLDEFIIEHYWGYSGGPGRPTVEYRVDHPRWKVWPATVARFTADVSSLYGETFVSALTRPPLSAFYVDGSAVTVFRGRKVAIPRSAGRGARPVRGPSSNAPSRYT